MYAPVVARFLTYGAPLAADSRAYCDAVRDHPLVAEWYEAAVRRTQGMAAATNTRHLA